MDDLISRKYLYDKMLEKEELARQRVLDTPTHSPAYLRYVAQLNERTALKHEIADAPDVTYTNVGSKWIPCSERMPENEKEVEISCIRRYIGAGDKKEVAYFTARAFYTDGTMTTEDSAYVWEDCDNWEYNEEKDAYIIPEGWWECVTFSEEFGVVDAEVIAWKPLPEPYKGEQHEID